MTVWEFSYEILGTKGNEVVNEGGMGNVVWSVEVVMS